jgi:hypothetical protein
VNLPPNATIVSATVTFEIEVRLHVVGREHASLLANLET